jgi:hypothetical protein
MEHSEIRRKLPAYLDNALAAEEKEEIKRHLGRCGNCRGEIADLELTIGYLKSLPEVEPPPWLMARILAKARDETGPKKSIWRKLFFPLHLKLPVEAVALVFLCVTGYYLARTIGEQAPLTAPPATRQQTLLPSAPPPAASAPSPHHGSGSPATIPREKMEAPQSGTLPPPATAPPPSPALPLRPMAEPELQPADEEITPEREVVRPLGKEEKAAPQGAMKRARKAPADEAQRGAATPSATPDGKEEVTLLVDDPVAAAGAIEEAVTRGGGRISGHSYSGENHLLFIRIGAQKVPGLLDRLGRIGTVEERPQLPTGANGITDLIIRW